MGILKKIKKGLKKVAKPALGIGAALLAAKALKGRKGTDADANDGFREKYVKPSIGMVTDGSNQDMPGNLSRSAVATGPRKRNMYSPNDFGLGPYAAKDGGRIGKKSGGRVKKSMGKALRGGGKVMR